MPTVPFIGKPYRRLNRYRQIASVAAKYGFGDLVDRIRLWEHVNLGRRFLRRPSRKLSSLSLPERVRLALQELGPTYVKLGQMLSTRPDLVPHEYIIELEKLQSGVAPIPSEVALAVVRTELGQPIEDVFDSFEYEPLAAASIGQVHRATLPGNRPVAVKIQRPGIANVIEVDLEIMHSIARLAESRMPEARTVGVVGIVQEFASNIRRELDLRLEGNNVRRSANNFSGNPTIYVPDVYHDLCTKRLLVMEFVEGIPISKTEKLAAEGYDLGVIAQRGVNIALESSFEHGFFHADPHPGNIMIMPGNVICLLDYGMMGTLSPRQRESMAKLGAGVVNQNERMMSRAIEGLAKPHGPVDVDLLEADLSELAQQYAGLPVKEIRFGTLLSQVTDLLVRHDMRLEPSMIWLFKAIGTLEDVARKLDAEFDMIGAVKPYAERLLRRRLGPMRQIRELYLPAMDLMELAKEFPYAARDILRQLKEGRFKVEMEHDAGMELTRRTLDRASNRVTLGLVVAALVIGSSVLVHAQVPPVASNISIIGITSYAIAWAIGLWLVISIVRGRK